jgi:hypothetical protein
MAIECIPLLDASLKTFTGVCIPNSYQIYLTSTSDSRKRKGQTFQWSTNVSFEAQWWTVGPPCVKFVGRFKYSVTISIPLRKSLPCRHVSITNTLQALVLLLVAALGAFHPQHCKTIPQLHSLITKRMCAPTILPVLICENNKLR